MSNAAVAVVAAITSAFANGPTLPRESVICSDTWETDDLIRDLAAVGDLPDDAFIAQHFSSLPAFTPEGLRSRAAALLGAFAKEFAFRCD